MRSRLRFAVLLSILIALSTACALPLTRTELFFGMQIPTGGQVSATQWQEFVAGQIAPRFPDGFTIMEAEGQWKGENGDVVREPSHVLLLIHSGEPDIDRKVEEIRAAYKRMFQQEAVLRIDARAKGSF